MFKHMQIYRLPAPWQVTAGQLADALRAQAFAPASSNELVRQGWAAPRGDGTPLVHAVAGQFLLRLASEKKVLPAKAVKQRAKEMAGKLEEEQGFPPGKMAMKELQERAADEMLPQAFPIRSHVDVWIDPKNGWLVIDAASAGKADDVVKMLVTCVDRMPLESLRVQHSPVAMMTAWLDSGEAPAGFTLDQDTILRATGESRAQVGYKKHTLDPEDMRRHIATGKQCTRLAMTWSSKISFVLHEDLSIRSIKALDVLKEGASQAFDAGERFDSDFNLMTGEYALLLADLVAALGGEARA
ncbi:recombination-associated protein RdgC [Massilia forsythiae]|uniref:Recombination-associated protein RdgC n=1 Tax=Massilia forsythiae TaxID=2728020 RepID=A0A7Z2ZS30_9BURK|nr:recombination-associated protein RdgC [Massilia forsythiae]QJD98646.1 recombination-associated protein RdgC [Massilia forsythiae]